MGLLPEDLRAAIRLYRNHRGLTVVAALTLGLGIGATSGMFGAVNSLLLQGPPYRDTKTLVQVWNEDATRGSARVSVSSAEFAQLQDDTKDFSALGMYKTSGVLLRKDGLIDAVGSARVSSGLMQLLGISPLQGRLFLPDENEPGNDHVAILNYSLWRKLYSADPRAVGRVINLNGEIFTIVGIMPATFVFPNRIFDIWLPLTSTQEDPDDYDKMVIARLRPGVKLSETRGPLSTISLRLSAKGGRSKALRVHAEPLEGLVKADARLVLLVLFGMVSLLLMIACADVASVFLAVAFARRKEIAIRRALGATPLRIARQLLTEGILLAVLGGLIGVVVAIGIVQALRTLAPPRFLPLEHLAVDKEILLFAVGISLLSGIIVSLIPSIRFSRRETSELLKNDTVNLQTDSNVLRGFGSLGFLVIGEITFAYLLLVGAALTLQSYSQLTRLNLGFDPQNVFSIWVPLLSPDYSDPTKRAEISRQIIDRVEILPGVKSAGLTGAVPPFGASNTMDFEIVGGHPPRAHQPDQARFQIVTSEYFQTMGIHLLRGRLFSPEDDSKNSPALVIVNTAMARAFWANADPIGKAIRLPGFGDSEAGVIGIVDSTRDVDPRLIPDPEMYFLYGQFPVRNFSLLVQVNPVTNLLSGIRTQIIRLGSDQSVGQAQSLEEMVVGSVGQSRFGSLLMTLFAGIALALALAGAYGIVWYSVRRRTKEIGIRAALGARPGTLLWLVVGQILRLSLIAVGIGIVLALGLTRVLKSLLFNMSPTDPLTFILVAILLVSATFVAAYAPARRAMRVDPMVALRHE